jgi:hypothetical protein
MDMDLEHCLKPSSVTLSEWNGAAGREDLMNIARTTLSSKILSQHKDFFSNLAVDAVLRYHISTCTQRSGTSIFCHCYDGSVSV